MTDLDLSWAWTAGGLVSSARDLAGFHRALLGGELLSTSALEEMLTGVESDWEESDLYGLGICEITSFMGTKASPCGPAWGHLGLGLGYTCVVLSG